MKKAPVTKGDAQPVRLDRADSDWLVAFEVKTSAYERVGTKIALAGELMNGSHGLVKMPSRISALEAHRDHICLVVIVGHAGE